VETSASNFGAPPFAIGPEFLWRRFQHTRGAYADDHSLLRRIFSGGERNGSMTATILNLNSTLKDWQAGGVAGGNSTFGTIDANGLYTAQRQFPPTTSHHTALPMRKLPSRQLRVLTILQPTKITRLSVWIRPLRHRRLTVASSQIAGMHALTSQDAQVPVFWQVNGN